MNKVTIPDHFRRRPLVGAVLGGAIALGSMSALSLMVPCAAAANPEAQKRKLMLAAACNPCAVKKACNPCNPCARKKSLQPLQSVCSEKPVQSL